ncbi:ABC transporter permease [Streptosporangium lutulentum]
MSETVIRAPATPLRASQPSAIRLGLSRAAIETRMFFREKDAVIFTFSFPIILLVIFGSIFADDLEGTGLNVSQLYVAGLIGSAAMTGFQNLGINIAGDRDDGTLKRLRGTPLPAGSYFIGKALNTLFISFVQVVILLTIGVTMFGLELPSEAARWATFVWVFVLGVFGSSLLGIAASSLPRSAKSASAVIAMPFVVLQFISGVFIPIGQLPRGWWTSPRCSPSSGCARVSARSSSVTPVPHWRSRNHTSLTASPWSSEPGSSEDWCCA